MVALTGKWIWLPAYAGLAFWLVWRFGWNGVLVALGCGLVLVATDQLSSGLLKPLVGRLRPSHNPEVLPLLHIVDDIRGSRFGFVSSHAANSFGFSTFIALMVGRGRRWVAPVFFLWAFAVSYSRIYLGVHYPGDILCGALLGVGIAYLAAWAFRRVFPKRADSLLVLEK